MSDLHLEIISPTGPVFQGSCKLAVIPSAAGDVGVMYGHEALIASLRQDSKIDIYDEKDILVKSIEVKSGGFAEMQGLDNLSVIIN